MSDDPWDPPPMRLRPKLTLMVGVPICGALVLATLVLRETWRDSERTAAFGSLEHVSDLGRQVTVLMRRLQKERLSATVPASQRQRVWAGARLPQARAETDVALLAYREAAAALDKHRLTPATATALDAANGRLGSLPALRKASGPENARGLDEIIGGYGNVIESLIGLVTSLRGISADHEIAVELSSLVSLLRVGEHESRLNALLGFVLSLGEFPPGSFRRLVTISTEADVHRSNLRVDADEGTRKAFAEAVALAPSREAAALITAALASVEEMPKTDPNHWHDVQGRLLSALRTMEDGSLSRIAQRSTFQRAAGRRKAIGALSIAGIAVLGSLLLAWRFASGLHRSLASLHSVAHRVRTERDFGARAVKTSADEIGHLAESWNEMLSGIQERDVELSNHKAHLEQTVSERTAELAAERHRLELILTSAGEGIVGLDEGARITLLNPAAAKLLGADAAKSVGHPFHDLIRHDTGKGPCTLETCPILRTLRHASLGSLEGHRLSRQDGSSFAVEGLSTAILVDGRVAGAVLTIWDVTARKSLENQLQQARKLEAVGQLASGIAHEINTPMQFIGDNVTFLRDAVGDLRAVLDGYRTAVQQAGVPAEMSRSLTELEEARDLDYVVKNAEPSCNQALEGVDRVRKIVSAMKDFAHPGGKEKDVADLNRAVESSCTVATNVWKHVAELDLRLDVTLPPIALHVGEINQVVLNLVVNAAHAIGDAVDRVEKGRITVSTQHDDTHVEIRVTDTGPGIPVEVRDRIFEPFFTTKEVGKGTGQGLTLARSIVVDRHGGSLAFETEVGRGTTFIVRLPKNDPAEAEQRVA